MPSSDKSVQAGRPPQDGGHAFLTRTNAVTPNDTAPRDMSVSRGAQAILGGK
ncbi:hypothetical protein [uncultured Litoreibacter sp.]|uniref:hypothetical protein n=1 Tax=uncultured Litoreibacter sp. TaxID=1392394 RepID=UPI0026045BAB|nr:hypothetical protein [uncultured Litoreibacter sp.]